MKDILLETACLPLYSESAAEGRFVPVRNSLNMWNASGRPRHEDEIGIPIPIEFRNMHPDFFPGTQASFRLVLPNLSSVKAKQCQQGGKALMSNPNKDLGRWLLRTVLRIPKHTVVTYPMLVKIGIDSVYLEKWKGSEIYYKIYPAPAGEYDRFIRGGKAVRKNAANETKKPEIKDASNAGSHIIKKQPEYTLPAPGTKIKHRGYGEGIVVSAADDMIKVEFADYTKTLKYSMLVDKKLLI